MNKNELIDALCAPDTVGGDMVRQSLQTYLADIPDEDNTKKYRHRFESALDSVFGSAHGIALLPGQDMVVEDLWEQYSDRLSELLRA